MPELSRLFEENMKQYRKTIFIAVMILMVGGLSYFFTRQRENMSDLPTLSRRSGSANVSSEFLNAQKAVEYYREEIRKKPDVVKNYVELAQLFLQESRITGNHHEYIPKAQRLINEALKRDPNDFQTNITNASLLMTLHHFQDAKEIAGKIIGENPYSATAYGVLCDADVESGLYDEAVKACDRMLTLRPDLRSYSRASYLRELHGDPEGAADAMKLAAEAGMSGQENRAWALYNLGKLYLNEGKLDTAEFIFNGILTERPEYGYAISGLAQVRRAEGKTQEAIDLLSKAYQATPEHLFIEQLAEIYRMDGQLKNADGVVKIVLQMFEQHEKDGWNINREYAMFCANHDINLSEALDRMKKEYKARPENIDVLETYAWTLYKAGRVSESMPLIDRAMRLNTSSFSLHHHAGMIYSAAGMKEKAEQMFERSRSENPFWKVMLIDGVNNASPEKSLASIQ